MGKIEIKVSGMKCEHCKKAVQKALLGIEGVDSVEIDLETGITQIDTSRDISLDEIRKAIKEAGYEVS